MKKIKLRHENKTYDVEVREVGQDTLEVSVNGHLYRFSVDEVAEIAGDGVLSFNDGEMIRFPPESLVPTSSVENDMEAGRVLTAPMPGEIVQISVSLGEEVAKGDALCVLEAMKMNNVLRAATPGIVESIEVAEGQKVEYGAVLVRFR